MREQIIGKYICEKKSVSRINITSLQRHVEIDRLIEFLVEPDGSLRDSFERTRADVNRIT